MKLGIDIGFGDVKVAIEPNGCGIKQFKFPTAIKYAAATHNDFLDKAAEGREFDFEGRKYLIGENAKHQAFSTKSFAFLKRYAPLFAFVASKMAETETGERVTDIGLGLPLTYYSEKDGNEMLSKMKTITVNGETLEVNPEVYVQGYGVLIDYLGGMEPDLMKSVKDLLVIDVGFNTVDIINVSDGKVSREGSDTLDNNGVTKITDEIIQYFRGKHNLSHVEAVDLLRTGVLKVFGENEDHSELVRGVTERYVDWLFNEINTRYYERMKRTQKTIMAGGGAYFLRHYLPAEYARSIYVPDMPEFSNARGFLSLLRSKEAKARRQAEAA